jgi:hypothetical protein
MAYPHVIRLRGPWECDRAFAQTALPDGAVTESAVTLPEIARIKVPADWSDTLGPTFRGRVGYSRRFNRPTNLEPYDRVWLVVEGVDARGRVALDGHGLGTIDGYALPAEWDITEFLQPSGVIHIDVELPPTGVGHPPPARPGRESLPGGLIGEVRLEIRQQHYVADLSTYWTAGAAPQLHVAGRVAGPSSHENLKLVVTACNRELAYQSVDSGAPFNLVATTDDWPAWPDPMDEPVLTPVEIRLTNGRTTLWQTTLETAPPQPDTERTRSAMAQYLSSDKPLAWLDYVDITSEAFLHALAQPGRVIGLRGILPDVAYDKLDRANVGVVQQVPRTWAERVCARLAHHPCILAWTLPAEEQGGADQLSAMQSTFNRPWLPNITM